MIHLKALITGASGFVGSALTRSLLNKNIEVLGFSRSSSFLNGQKVDYFNCDILDKERLKKIIGEFKPDLIFHLAGPAFIPDTVRDPRKTYEVIFNGTLNLLETVKELEIKARILYISSADIYGYNQKELISESESCEPNSPYSSAKACAELLCKQYSHSYDLNVVIARPFNHTGPGQSVNFVCSSFAYQVAFLQKSMDYNTVQKISTGNIDIYRDFMDVRDVVEAYYKILIAGKSGEVYNVCSGKATSLRYIINTLFDYAEIQDYEIIIDPMKVRKNDIRIRVGDKEKIEALTGWKSNIQIENTLQDIFLYWKENLNA